MTCLLVSAVLRGSVETLDKPFLFKCVFVWLNIALAVLLV